MSATRLPIGFDAAGLPQTFRLVRADTRQSAHRRALLVIRRLTSRR
jgi:hypothetical protein